MVQLGQCMLLPLLKLGLSELGVSARSYHWMWAYVLCPVTQQPATTAALGNAHFGQDLVACCQDGALHGASHPLHGGHLCCSPRCPCPFLVLHTRGQEVTRLSPRATLGLVGIWNRGRLNLPAPLPPASLIQLIKTRLIAG